MRRLLGPAVLHQEAKETPGLPTQTTGYTGLEAHRVYLFYTHLTSFVEKGHFSSDAKFDFFFSH